MTEQTEILVRLAETCAAYWHDGKIPPDRAQFVAKMLNLWLPQGALSAEVWLRERETCAEQLTMAVDCLARERAARWRH